MPDMFMWMFRFGAMEGLVALIVMLLVEFAERTAWKRARREKTLKRVGSLLIISKNLILFVLFTFFFEIF